MLQGRLTPPLFYIYYMNHFFDKIHGWFNYESVYKYVVRLFPAHAEFLEVGVYKGRSTAFLAVEIVNSGKKHELTSVDIFEPSKIMALGGESYSIDEFCENLAHIGDLIFHDIVKAESIEAAKEFDNGTFDFVFIDAGHTYEEVLSDIQAWLPKMKDGGIISGHDYSANWPGIEKSVKEVFGTDYTVIGNSWMHVVPSTIESLSQFNVLCTVLNYEREKYVSGELDKFNVKWHKIQCVLVAELHKGTVWMANAMSFMKAFNYHLESESDKPLLVLEDDIKFLCNPDHLINEAIKELPEDWDLLYLGANLRDKCTPFSATLDRVSFAWCTHSVAYSQKAIRYILGNFDPMSGIPFDEWLRQDKTLNCFITKPMLITQKAGFSYIQNTEVNYECIFESQSQLTKW